MSHFFRALLLASMLAGIGAYAGETTNRNDLNGWRLNGLGINRIAFNGQKAQVPQLNGIALDLVGVR
ncbi:MAG TPA: hypothetical protein VGF26_24375 [Ramlibacter sp.]